MGAFIQMPGAEPLGGVFQLEQVLPVRPHPQKHRQRQRHADKHQQHQIQQAHLMQVEQIRNGANHQHIVAARNALHKGVLIVEGDDFPQPQPLFQILAQLLFAERLDMQLERQVEIQRGDGLVPVLQRDFAQLAAHQVQRTFHQIVHRLAAGALGGHLVHQADQHRHH